jgi:hypothetical protein
MSKKRRSQPVAAAVRAKRANKSRKFRRSWWRGPWPVVVAATAVAIVIGIFVVLSRSSNSPRPAASPPLDTATVVDQATHVSASVIDAVGTGGLQDPLKVAPAGGSLNGGSGNSELLYIGAEWCPYCAAERWSLVVALSRFGTFSGLKLTTSSSTDVYPDTPTFSFHGSSYQSRYLDFAAVELATRTGAPQQSPSPEQSRAMNALDPSGGIPFIDVGGLYYEVSSGYVPDVLAGKDWEQVAAALSVPQSPSAKDIVGNANYLTAAICQTTNQQPASVCQTPVVQQIEPRLGR